MSRAWVVVKVGGSLLDWPMLAERLRAFVAGLRADGVLLVPGGGAAADVIRAFDRTHSLGDDASHWLAIQALSVNARLLKALFPEAHLLDSIGAELPVSLTILDAYPFFLDDEARPDHLPHRWDVTSDSLAVRVAGLLKAQELILLKSTDWAGENWDLAHKAGVVDAYFPSALQQLNHALRVRVVNLRTQAS